jgi:hypothetical protein
VAPAKMGVGGPPSMVKIGWLATPYFFIILFFILNSILLLFSISGKCVPFVALEFLGSHELDILQLILDWRELCS